MIFIILNAALAAYLIWASLNVNTKKKNYESRMINILLYGAIATFSMMVVLICIIYRLERIVILLEHLQIFLISAIFIESSLFFVTCMKDKITKFVSFNMVDKDVVIEAKVFGASDSQIELIQEGKVYNSAVDVKPYDRSPSGYSCIIYNMDFSELPSEQFIDWAENLDACQKVIEDTLPEILNTYYGQIAYPILANNWEKFARWTAASNQHHTRLGELLVHTSEVMTICSDLADYFNEVYGDLEF